MPRGSWYAEAKRVLDRNPDDRAVRIERKVIEGCVEEMEQVAKELAKAEKELGALRRAANAMQPASQDTPGGMPADPRV